MPRKYTVRFSKQDISADLELCIFCKNLVCMDQLGLCSYYEQGYIDNKCSGYIKADNIEERFDEGIEFFKKCES